MTSSAAKKASGKAQSADYYLQEKWSQFKKDMKNEYDMIVLMHSTLMQLDDTFEPYAKPSEDPIYSVEGFEGPKLIKAQSVSSTPNSFSNKKPR